MNTIPHRELRNNSSEILRRVEAGESFEVSNHGRVVAVISPKRRTRLDELRAAGKVREPSKDPVDLTTLPFHETVVSTEKILSDLRGDR